MSGIAVILSALIVVVLLVFGIQWKLTSTYRLVRGVSRGRDALERLLHDIRSARSSLLVLCDECHADAQEEAKIVAELEAAKRRTPDLKVEFVWGPRGEPPAYVTRLKDRGIITVHRARERLPFRGRLIDGKTLELHGPDGRLLSRSFVRANRAAPGVAERLTELAHAV